MKTHTGRKSYEEGDRDGRYVSTSHVRMEAEMEVMCLQGRDCWQPPEARREGWERRVGQTLSLYPQEKATRLIL